jgi:signal transduction histidine kinase
VAQFASLHGGRAWVEPRAGGGACFQVLLPDSPDEVAPPADQASTLTG